MKPAVAVMAKVPGATTVKSRLHGALTPERATELYRCFLLDRLDALAALTGIAPLVAYTPPEARDALAALVPPGLGLLAQRGADLGERLSNLLADLVGAGHPGALAIDSDSPTLPMTWVLEAVRALEHGAADVAIGPCDDGGYYLIGLRAPRPALFDGMPWSTERVLALTLDRAKDLGLRVHLLPPWFDVDTEPDLRRLHAELAGGGGPRRTRAFVEALFPSS
ncbi:MAG: TIGR04282 family arsenosugar biosynthesis glycosyltransferase [Candidatus Rokubacteria bacterium]|nr:TIGR04282 family arsenosugar biosynthesis glycosyltransferase [Candidatus Rokubacteria bacterium]